ncbi:MAG: hypothetical protein LAO06_09030 [Acidobacteriia bacterium]|nr:hypothetical protein [Terriglobia bacterium]
MEKEPVAPAESAESTAQRAEQERLTSILRRVQLGDTSVTDEVYWLQMQEDFVTRKK